MHLSELIIRDKAKVSLDDVLLDDDSRAQIHGLIREHAYADELLKYDLPVNNKILLYGSSGCGKTTTAKAIAYALNKDLLILNLSNIVSARIGETAQHISKVFEQAARTNAVLFLDEFDQIAKARSVDDKDVGEMRRLINTLIQLIDLFPSTSVLICATNHRSFIDPALLRRFQLNLSFTMPSKEILDGYYDRLLERFPEGIRSVGRLYDISFAEAKDHAYTAVKQTLIADILSHNT